MAAISNVTQDIRYALRQLKRSPGFAVTAVLTIALGIGANTAIFTLAHAVLLRQLPVTDPAGLYRIGDGDDCCVMGGMPDQQKFSIFPTEVFELFHANVPEFEQIAATPAGGLGPSFARRAGTNEAARNLGGSYVSGNYFQLFGVRPERGRLLQPSDDKLGTTPVAVMSYTTWANLYQSDPTIIGSTFLLDNRPVTIVGVTPPSFYGDRVRDSPPDFYLPISAEPLLSDTPISTQKDLRWLYMIGRLKPGVSRGPLEEKLNALLRGYLGANDKLYQSEEGRKELPKVHLVLKQAGAGIEQMQSQFRTGLRILLGISALVLLIACANIANLLLARGMTRRAETSVRVALGAARARIVRQTLTESLVLAMLGGALGVALAFAGAHAMLALAFPEARNLPISATPSLPVLGFTLAIAVVTGILFGVVPAWSATRQEPAEALRGLNRSSRDRASLPQRSLVVLQAMLSLVLVTVAALLTRSLGNLEHQNFGLQTENRIVVHLDPVASGYTPERMAGLIERLKTRVSAIPGTRQVAFANYTPLEGENWGEGVYVEGRPDPGLHERIGSSLDHVSPGFFNTVGQRLLQGRDFSMEDRSDTPQVSIVNEAFVRKFFPRENPLGRRFGTTKRKFDFTIIGIVADAKYTDISHEVRPMFFRDMLQTNPKADPKDTGEIVSRAPHAMVIQTSGAQEGYDRQLRRAIAEVDSSLPIRDLRSLDSQIAGQLNDSRMVARLTGAFGILALVLASVGLYGVTAYSVAQRVPEIGLRMALGADRSSVLRLVLRGAMTQSMLGLALGLPAALVAGHYLQSQLYGIKGHDALTLSGACIVLAVSALVASMLPARRASAIEPMQALRSE